MKCFSVTLLLLLCVGLHAFGEEKLNDLKSIDELQKQFNSHAGKVRLVALLSPT
jgi:hypothetical protein